MTNSISPSATPSRGVARCVLPIALDGYPFIIGLAMTALLSLNSGWFMLSIVFSVLFLLTLNYFRDFELCVNVGDKVVAGKTILARQKA